MVIDAVGWSDVDFDINRFITTPEYYQVGLGFEGRGSRA